MDREKLRSLSYDAAAFLIIAVVLAFIWWGCSFTAKARGASAGAGASWMKQGGEARESPIAARDMGEGEAMIKAGNISALRPAGLERERKELDPNVFLVVHITNARGLHGKALRRPERDARGVPVRERRHAFLLPAAGTVKNAKHRIFEGGKLQQLASAEDPEIVEGE